MPPRYPTGASISTPVETAVFRWLCAQCEADPGIAAALRLSIRECALPAHTAASTSSRSSKPNRKRAKLCRRRDRRPGREPDHPVPMPVAGRGRADRSHFAWPVTCGTLVGYERLGNEDSLSAFLPAMPIILAALPASTTPRAPPQANREPNARNLSPVQVDTKPFAMLSARRGDDPTTRRNTPTKPTSRRSPHGTTHSTRKQLC